MIRTFAAAALLLLAACAAPYDMPAEDRAVLQARIDSYELAFARDDFATLTNAVPPRVVNALSERSGVPAATLRQGLIDLAEKSSGRVNVESFDMDTENAQFGKTSEGRGYALIPTRTIVVDAAGTRIQTDTTTLAFEDDGIWYLVRVEDEQQTMLLRDVYPEFTGVRFPKGGSRILE